MFTSVGSHLHQFHGQGINTYENSYVLRMLLSQHGDVHFESLSKVASNGLFTCGIMFRGLFETQTSSSDT